MYEPFSGSGTTLIAAETIERVCFAVELDPRYVDMAVRRWQAFTGKQAIRQRDRIPFDTPAEPRDAASVSTERSIDDWINLIHLRLSRNLGADND